jgi:hypothetical protein
MTHEEREARNARVEKAIEGALCDLDGRIAQLRDQLRSAEAGRAHIARAVENGHWWKLRQELDEEDVESLLEE